MEKTDKKGYEKEYKNKVSDLLKCSDINEYKTIYETQINPFYLGGNTKGYVRGLSIIKIIEDCQNQNKQYDDVTILDCGCGLGELSVYLATIGFNVVGVDISEEGVHGSRLLAEKFNLKNCKFYAASLENIPLEEHSVDFIIGHAALHHFIKYDKIPGEFKRVMKPEAKGYFADSFGENKLYHIFHDKKKMKELGDVTLTKKLIYSYFEQFNIKIFPTDWFVMFDKLYIKIIPNNFARKISKFHFKLDRKINPNKRSNLYLSGAVLTEIKN